MPLTMSPAAREEFLAQTHIGIISVVSPEPDRSTVTVPIWYGYDPSVGVSILTATASRKARALATAGRFALVAQTEQPPWKYVSVEGPVVDIRPCDYERDLLSISVRYMGTEIGEAYASSLRHANDDHTVYVMRPEHWHSEDHTELWAGLTEAAG